MKCTYENWLARKDEAVRNAQYAVNRGDSVMADYWRNHADFCQKMLDKMINQTAEKWIEKNWMRQREWL